MNDWEGDEPVPSRVSRVSGIPQTQPPDAAGHEGTLIGQGGQGIVVQGRDRHLPRDVAWKIAEDPRSQARLRHEAKVLSMLEHPHIVPIYDLVDDGLTVRMATRFVRGRTLRVLLKQLRSDPGEGEARPGARDIITLLQHMLAVSQAIGFAHERGIVHGDIKPENIMIGDRGETQVIDWGLSLITADTQSIGDVVGTVTYMSPEQARGEGIGPTSDVWALGATLVEVLTGRALWSQPGPAVLAALRNGVRPRLDTASLPLELTAILGRALAPDLEARYSDAHALAVDIEAYLGKLADERRPKAPRQDGAVAPAAAVPSAMRAAASGADRVTRYATSGDVSIAYQVFGSGPSDLVVIPGFVSHLDVTWEDPSLSSFLERLGARHRVILFDKRGTGLSDRVDVSSLGDRLEDVRAVMHAAGSEGAAVLGLSEGGVLAMLFALLYPERVHSLAIYACMARSTICPGYSIGHPPELFEWAYAEIRQKWGGPFFLEVEAPSRLDDAAFVAWWARYLKMGASPGAAVALIKANAKIDVRHLLPGISAPTLVLSRVDDALTPSASCRYIAEHIPGGRYVALEGRDHLPFVGDSDAFVDAVLAFLDEPREVVHAPQCVAFVLVASPVAPPDGFSDQLRAALERRFAECAASLGGSPLAGAGPGQLAFTFRLPAAALACATALSEAAAELGAAAVVALHLDTLTRAELAPSRHIINRVAEFARNGSRHQVLVTRIVRDLASRVELTFEPLTADRDDPEALFVMKAAQVPDEEAVGLRRAGT